MLRIEPHPSPLPLGSAAFRAIAGKEREREQIAQERLSTDKKIDEKRQKIIKKRPKNIKKRLKIEQKTYETDVQKF
ncbi:MAG: hypothetical protein J5734_00865 [Prevotella sp.]|nr:hypothetical protein [Prevotella sp.]